LLQWHAAILWISLLLKLQAATYFCVRLGFKEIGYKGLETGSRQIAAHVVQQNKVCIYISLQLSKVK